MIEQWRNKIIQGDCRKLLEQLPDKSIGCIITDPVWPNASPKLLGSDRSYDLFKEAALHFPRIAARAVIHLGCTSDPRFLMGLPPEMKFIRSVNLRYARPSYIGRILMGNDMAYIFGKPPKARPGLILLPGEFTHTDRNAEKPNHPAPRQLSHVKFLVSKYTEEDEIILDPFMGSGTTAVACLICNRDFIGFELSPEYCKLAEKRLEPYQQQLKLELATK